MVRSDPCKGSLAVYSYVSCIGVVRCEKRFQIRFSPYSLLIIRYSDFYTVSMNWSFIFSFEKELDGFQILLLVFGGTGELPFCCIMCHQYQEPCSTWCVDWNWWILSASSFCFITWLINISRIFHLPGLGSLPMKLSPLMPSIWRTSSQPFALTT